MDIYRVIFNSIEPNYSIITGKLYAVNTNQLFDGIQIEVSTEEDGELYGYYIPNHISGKYVIILPPGKYSVRLEVEGFHEVVHHMEVFGKADYRTEINQGHWTLILRYGNIIKFYNYVTTNNFFALIQTLQSIT